MIVLTSAEVEVDQSWKDDQIADALHALTQHVIGNLERVTDRGLLVDHLHEPLVRNGDQRVDPTLEVGYSLLGRLLTAQTLEAERLGDHTDGQRTRLACDLRDDRCGARAGATAHARGDEHHVAVGQRLGQLLAGLLGSVLTLLGIATGAKSASQLAADADLEVCGTRS